MGDLSYVWMLFARNEGRRWIVTALDLVDDRTSLNVIAKLNYARAYLGADANVDLASSEETWGLYRELGDEFGAVRAQGLAGKALVTLGRIAEAEPLLLEALLTARRLGARRCLAELLRFIANVRTLRGDFASARSDLAEAASIFASIGAEESGTVNVSWNLADLEFMAGDVELALRHATDAVRILRAMNDTQNLSGLLINLSEYHIALGQYDDAESCAVEALGVAHEHQLPGDAARALQRLAEIAVLRPHETVERRSEAYSQAAAFGFRRRPARRAQLC